MVVIYCTMYEIGWLFGLKLSIQLNLKADDLNKMFVFENFLNEDNNV